MANQYPPILEPAMSRIEALEKEVALLKAEIATLSGTLRNVADMLGLSDSSFRGSGAECLPEMATTSSVTSTPPPAAQPSAAAVAVEAPAPAVTEELFFKAVRRKDGKAAFMDSDRSKSASDHAYRLVASGDLADLFLVDSEDAWANVFDGNDADLSIVAKIDNQDNSQYPIGLKNVIAGKASRTEGGWVLSEKVRIEYLY